MLKTIEIGKVYKEDGNHERRYVNPTAIDNVEGYTEIVLFKVIGDDEYLYQMLYENALKSWSEVDEWEK